MLSKDIESEIRSANSIEELRSCLIHIVEEINDFELGTNAK